MFIFSGSLTKFSTGLIVGWSSPSLPKLKAADSPVPITSAQSPWVAGAMQLGTLPSVFLMAATVDVFGRKRGILFSAIPTIISWILIAQVTSFEALITARVIGGLGSGYGKIVIGTYIGEIAQPSIRGALGTFMGITYVLGVLTSYSVGPLTTIKEFAYISTIIPVALFVTFMWMPETPYFYLMRGKNDKARETLEKLRGHTMVDEELTRMEKGIKKKVPLMVAFKKLISERKHRQPLYVICILFFSIQVTGKMPILSYCQNIFEESGGSISPYWGSIITCFIQLAALIISVFIIDKSGRRFLLISSCIGCAISLGLLAIYLFFKEHLKRNVDTFNWVPLFSLILYNFVFNIGLGNVPFIMVGELFANDVKSIAVCVTSLCLPISSITMLKFFQVMTDAYGMYTSFAFFSVVSILCTIYCYYCVPETKGKSLEEIQAFFIKKK